MSEHHPPALIRTHGCRNSGTPSRFAGRTVATDAGPSRGLRRRGQPLGEAQPGRLVAQSAVEDVRLGAVVAAVERDQLGLERARPRRDLADERAADPASLRVRGDHEHRELIGWINQALAAGAASTQAQAAVVDLLGEIFARISAHFALEERVMSARHYDRFEEHKRDHEALLDDIRDIMDGYEAGGSPVEERFAERLSEWFGLHFRTHDARFHGNLPPPP